MQVQTKTIIFFFILVFINLVGLWTFVLLPQLNNQVLNSVDGNVLVEQSNDENKDVDTLCPQQISHLEEQLTQLAKKVADLEAASISATVVEKTTIVQQPVVSTVKEQYIGFGSGSTSNTSWTDLPETLISINFDSYGSVQKATFEATLAIVGGGEAQARLVNKTTGAIIDSTEVSHNTNSFSRKVSGQIPLVSGGHEYVVQVRSTSGELARLGESRMKIELYSSNP